MVALPPSLQQLFSSLWPPNTQTFLVRSSKGTPLLLWLRSMVIDSIGGADTVAVIVDDATACVGDGCSCCSSPSEC